MGCGREVVLAQRDQGQQAMASDAELDAVPAAVTAACAAVLA
jgi:hypothetical protein